MLRDAINGQVEVYASAGMGEDARLAGRNTLAAVLVVDGEIVHLAAFPVARRFGPGSYSI